MNNHIAITSCPEVSEVMLPKLTQHGMTVFNYYRIYFDGRVIRLSSDQEWTEHYFNKDYINTMTLPDSYLVKPLNYYVWLTDDCPEMLLDAALNFNTSNGISIAEMHPDYIEYYCYATTNDNQRIINNFYLGNLELLHKYGLEFKDQAVSLLKKAEKHPLQLTNIDICHADCRLPDLPSRITFPKRQADCARLLLQGKSYKEIASELELSVRTIEAYINILKDKLKCCNKTELIIKLIELI